MCRNDEDGTGGSRRYKILNNHNYSTTSPRKDRMRKTRSQCCLIHRIIVCWLLMEANVGNMAMNLTKKVAEVR